MKGRPDITKEQIGFLYNADGKSAMEIGDMFQCCHSTILDKMEKHGIEKRSRRQALIIKSMPQELKTKMSIEDYLAHQESNQTRICKKCYAEKELKFFRKAKDCNEGRAYTCNTCFNDRLRELRHENLHHTRAKKREYYKNNIHRLRAVHRRGTYRRTYGITRDQYWEMVKTQEGKCKICGALPKRLATDHCHKTGKIRGLLCTQCNVTIAMSRERIDILFKIIEYLQEHKNESDVFRENRKREVASR
jgi:hypothetical protein